MTIAKISTAAGLSVYLKGRKPFTMPKNHKLYNAFTLAVKNDDLAEVLNIIDIAEKTSKYMDGKVTIRDGEVFYGAEPVHGVIADYILKLLDEGEDASFMVAFLENVMLNPSKQSREELFLFLQANNMPITEDGRFIAYKWVKADGWDVHTGKTNHHVVGGTYKMERSDVNDDRRVTCSTGLHVCSPGYTKFGDRLLLAAVNPAHVVSVPYDYNNSKMRVSEYEIVDEVAPETYGQHNSTVYRKA